MKILNILLLYFIFPGMLIFPGKIYPQDKEISFEEIEQLQKEEKRNVLVFIHTDWCKFCSAMENTTFKNNKVKGILSQKYYFISFDAEDEREVSYYGHTFRFKPTGRTTGIHELAEAIGTIDGELSFPVMVILNPENEIIFQYGGFLDADGLSTVLMEIPEI